VNNFIKQFSVSSCKNITGITTEAISLLENYSWPGNIRELRNVIERAVNLSSSQVLTIDDLPKSITGYAVSPVQTYEMNEPAQQLFEEFKQKVDERNQIIALMKKYKNNKSHVAKELGITRASLYRRLKAMNYNDCEE
ncbi:MAG: stc, partial [Firmicutes bacterium]|nr:stc [Bacillota bacterium]